jgi:excisionase family DNA binding protein
MASVEDVVAGRDRLLTAQEVGDRLRVDPKTVAVWARQDKIQAVRTLGGHRRYFESEVNAIMRGEAAS